MTDLSPKAKAIIEAASSSDGPTDADRERIRNRLIAQLGIAALGGGAMAAGSAAEAAASSTAPGASAAASSPAAVGGAGASTAGAGGGLGAGSSLGLVAKVAAATAVVGAVAIGATFAPWEELTGSAGQRSKSVQKQRSSQVEPKSPRGRPEAAHSALPATANPPPVALETTAQKTATPKSPAKPRSARRNVRSRVAASRIRASGLEDRQPEPRARGPADQHPELREEVDLLRSAQNWLRQDEPAQALQMLDLHSRKFPKGLLRQERRAARAIALCQLGRIQEGRREARLLLAESPRSPLWPRVRRSCSRPQR